MQNEADLISALRRRDPHAFSFLFDSYSDKIFRLAAGLLGDEDEAEGIVQESFLRLFTKLDQFEERAKVSTWLYRVAYNASIDQLRQRRPIQPLVDEPEQEEQPPIIPAIFVDWSQAPETMFASAEAQVELDRCVAQLPERLRSTFILRETDGLSTAETSEILEIKPGTVKVQLHRARLLLRECLTSYFGERLEAAQEKE
jgi:RNA polymerase sigma-70 factor (ECF subfamily)